MERIDTTADPVHEALTLQIELGRYGDDNDEKSHLCNQCDYANEPILDTIITFLAKLSHKVDELKEVSRREISSKWIFEKMKKSCQFCDGS